jgi:hypothetical protein
MKVIFLLAAEVDIQMTYSQLEDYGEGVGDAFLRALDEEAQLIERFPFSCRLHIDNYRRLVMSRFPFGLFYVIERDRIAVHAVMDLRQSPETIRRRMLGPESD